jgi:uncharacterized protein (DUF1330 family)
MSSAYIIAHVRITNPEQYEDYKKWATLAMQTHGVEVCVRGGPVQTLEGDWSPERVIVLKFPSAEAARAYNDSSEYGKARQARQGAAEMQMILVEGA